MVFIHCIVQLDSLGNVLFWFSLWIVPGPFFGITLVEVPSELSRYQKVKIPKCSGKVANASVFDVLGWWFYPSHYLFPVYRVRAVYELFFVGGRTEQKASKL